jgi:hypothetical protein
MNLIILYKAMAGEQQALIKESTGRG